MPHSLNQPKTAIVLVNWNGADDTISCLESLLDLRQDDFCIIIADNGSTDGSLEKISQWVDQVGKRNARQLQKIYDGHERRSVSMAVRGLEDIRAWPAEALITFLTVGWNSGFAFANNRGIEVALSCSSIEYVWLLNNDTAVDPDALNCLIDRMVSDNGIGLCGSTLVYFHNRRHVQGVGFRYIPSQCRGYQIDHMKSPEDLSDRIFVEQKMDYVIGASMLARRQFIEKVGLLSEKYFIYFEEFDWAIRAKGLFRLGWAPKSLVYHKEGGSIGSDTRGRPSDISTFYMSKNLLVFYREHFFWLVPVACARLCFNASRFILQRDWSALRALCRGVSASFRKQSANV